MSKERNDLDNYFMKPQFLEGVGNIYPIKVFEYERFRILASKYITQGIDTLRNLYKVPQNTNILNYFVDIAIKTDKEISYLESVQGCIPQNEDEQNKLNELNELYKQYKSGNLLIYSIKELEELFSIVLQKEVVFYCLIDNPLENYYFGVKNEDIHITKDNFEFLRNIIINQNLLYEMPTSSSAFINEMIQESIKIYNKDSNGGDLCAILSTVGIERGLSDEQIFNYTYYRLFYDYTIISRKYNNLFIFMLKSQGVSEAKIIELSEKVDLTFDPMDMIIDKNSSIIGNSLDQKLSNK